VHYLESCAQVFYGAGLSVELCVKTIVKNAFNLLRLCYVPYLLQGSTQYFKITLDSAGVATAAVTVFSGSPIVYIADQTLYPNASAGELPI
jgi:hypothetical protein